MNATQRMMAAAVAMLAVASGAWADGMIVPVRPEIRLRGSWAVKYHRVDIQVRGQVAAVSIDQEFVNTGSGMIEVEYFFPVPPDAAIDSMTLMVDGKEHVKLTESKMAGAEKEAFKELLDIIKRRNQIWYKAYIWIIRNAALYVPIPI